HVAGVHAEPQTRSGTDRDEHDVALAQIARVEPAYQVGRAFAGWVALVEFFGIVEVVDQHEGAARVRPGVEADRRPGPVHRLLPFDLVVERARAVAGAQHERSARLTPDDVAVRLALLCQHVLDQPRQAFRALAEHALGRAD